MKTLTAKRPSKVFGEFKGGARTLVQRTQLELVTPVGIKSSRIVSTSSLIEDHMAYNEIEKHVSTEEFYHVCDKVDTCLVITAPHNFVLSIGDVHCIVKRCFTFSGTLSVPVKVKALDDDQIFSFMVA